MYKRFLITALMLFGALSAEAQQSAKLPRIGFLHPASAASVSARREAFVGVANTP